MSFQLIGYRVLCQNNYKSNAIITTCILKKIFVWLIKLLLIDATIF